MLFKSFFILAAIGFTAAKVPSYIHVCGRRNPKLGECVIESVKALNDHIRDGIPELDVPPIEPLYIPSVPLADMQDFKAIGRNITLSGLSYHILHSVEFKFTDDGGMVHIECEFPNVKMHALYDVTARILVPIKGNGPITITTKNVRANVKLTFKVVNRGGVPHVYFPAMTTQLTVTDFDVDFVAENFDKVLQDAVSQALGSSHKEVLEFTKPNLEKAISERVLQISNQICKHFTYDELLPDTE